MDAIIVIGIGWAVMAVAMAGLWAIQLRWSNAGFVDVAWSFGTALLGVGFAWATDGSADRRILVSVMAATWGARLGGHLVRRVLSEAEDGRYQALRAMWGGDAPLRFFVFFQMQAFWAVMFAVPMLLAARSTRPGLGWPDALGGAIWLVALVGEAIADRQLAKFRARPESRGRVCQVGLWRYSRHPNYFFEWLHWWAYVSIGFVGPLGWLTLLGPVAMLYFLFRVTGIPPTEARALATRGDAYREYQRTTSVFVPWPRRREAP